MADVPSTPKFIQTEELEFLSPCSESMMQKIGGSINYILEQLEHQAVGSIVASMKMEPAFQAERGVGWVLADGRAATGRYAAITGAPLIPDLRGMFLRGRSYGNGANPDGDLAPGTFQNQTTGAHTHASAISNPFKFASLKAYPTDTFFPHVNKEPGGVNFQTDGLQVDLTLSISTEGGAESRPPNVTINWFIRVN